MSISSLDRTRQFFSVRRDAASPAIERPAVCWLAGAAPGGAAAAGGTAPPGGTDLALGPELAGGAGAPAARPRPAG
ncbi:MAG TPA: hypothetical protein VEV45_17460 [Streptosporangiaceae bacterium]|nr:hypothetical protein [Streptosporangiaceae bacterium]